MILQNKPPGIFSKLHTLRGVSTYLKHHWINLVRIASGFTVLLALALLIASLQPYFTYLHTLNSSSIPDPRFGPIGQLTSTSLREYQALGFSLDFYAWYLIILRMVFLLIFVTTGGVLFWRTWGKSNQSIALIASAFLVLFPASFSQAPFLLLPAIWTMPIATIYFLGNTCLGLFFYLFPNGRLVPGWIGFLIVGWIGYWFVDTFFPPSKLNLYAWILFVIFLAALVSLVWTQIYRYKHTSLREERQQTKWVVFGTVVSLGGAILVEAFLGLLSQFYPHVSQPYYLFIYTFLNAFLCLIPLSISFAVLRYRLWDIDIIIKRTLVYSVLTACVVGIYIFVVGYLGTLLHTGSNLIISLLATGLVAVLFQPLRELLQHSVNRLFYGQRDEPYLVISRLGQRLEATLAPDATLSVIVETVAQALKLPYAAIVLEQEQISSITTSYGTAVEPVFHLPLLYQREQVGELLLAPRARGEAFTPADLRLLDDLARQIGVAAHAVRLTADLQRSRERLVTAREEERRRLRRDLHDGLGPALASITLKLDAVRNLLTRDLSAADALLLDLKKQTQAAVVDIRHLVYELRPPSLDDLGLIQALREQAEQYIHDGLHMTIDMPELLPPLPAAVEVAAYRIVLEAMTNVVRHAQAQTCTIHLALNDNLDMEICDDGRGIAEGQRAGVGLTSIRERVAELGGMCEIENIPVGGTRLHVRLPLPKETKQEE